MVAVAAADTSAWAGALVTTANDVKVRATEASSMIRLRIIFSLKLFGEGDSWHLLTVFSIM
jgi:hypothetical protein